PAPGRAAARAGGGVGGGGGRGGGGGGAAPPPPPPRARRDGPRVVRGASPAGNGPAAPKTGSVRLSRPLCGLLGLCRLERWRLP
ncbi:hypothetical protein GSH05_18700, partial [Burkholderia pseudomallei]|uniref:hypothetical protein n=1 Tax=Burkholderia pseudomallei TaxID=28450 RepID=UPI0019402600